MVIAAHTGISERLFAFPRRDFIAAGDLDPPDLTLLLDLAEAFADKAPQGLDGLESRSVLLLTDGTDDLSAYAHAVRRLGGDVAELSYAGDDAALFNTRLKMAALKLDMVVFAHKASGAAEWLARHSDCPLINAGDGANQSPVDALGDALSLSRAFGQIDGLNIALIGDITHSAVARSGVILLSHLGGNIRLIGPMTLIPGDAEQWGCDLYHDLDEGLAGVDAVILLPLSPARIDEGLVPSEREYFRFFGLERHKLKAAKPHLKLLHTGPVRLGVEISADLASDPQTSLLGAQAEARMAAKLAVLSAMAQRLEAQA